MMKIFAPVLVLLLPWSPGPSNAQQYDFSDIDCRESRLAPLPNVRCVATNVISGGGGPGGVFRLWHLYGKNRYLNVQLHEALDSNSYIEARGTGGADYIKRRDSRAASAAEFKGPTHYNDSDYLLFKAATGEECGGFRRYGPARGLGFAWIMSGVTCEAKGRAFSDEQMKPFIDSIHLQSSGEAKPLVLSTAATMLAGGEWAVGRWEGTLSAPSNGEAPLAPRRRTLIVQKSNNGAATCLWFISNDPNSRQWTRNCKISPEGVSLETAASSLVELRRSGQDGLQGRFMPVGSTNESQVQMTRAK